ncbi:MAG: DUF192 domain-containing protein [Nanoarchaeota archaeon]|nr:DUF192 domain-containing protein [Nanoarchaeota archaeon]
MKACSVKYNNILLGKRVKYCDNFFTRFRGLMFSRKKDGVILEGLSESVVGSSIHMFFVFYPLDIFWLNKNYRVVDIKRKVMPFTLFHKPKNKAKYILELPVGKGDRVHVGGILKFGRIR